MEHAQIRRGKLFSAYAEVFPHDPLRGVVGKTFLCLRRGVSRRVKIQEGEENFVGDSEIIALGGASNETKDRPLG